MSQAREFTDHGDTTPVIWLHDDRLREGLEELRWGLDRHLARGPSTLVIDVSGVESLSAVTVAALLWVKRRCQARRVQVLVRNPTRRGREVLHRTGLHRAMNLEVPGGRFQQMPKSVRGAFCA